ncbi:radical SAM protein [Candidatus Parcubacteria bacterium]|nr:4Fe-4S cluster-binding domain-containing protein [Patescibacteria group bacterium]MBU4309583.1 4Fe-4S cluster-binding domain-containing protein [Patescibacteria group bacterium]MBU4432545.1 4Fe-4S cluster-binding domain-containing protein [Patescibacteria group bacterium]MBU4578029.1 4Fe-4S cluster-binding domain-containing protein [Patescibacteria group bacterium]MCG2696463.1 radical SAM protein [Candidatus Parcubacteria bacterium]
MLNNNPSVLNLFFTGKCNLNCKYCFVDRSDDGDSTLNEELIRKAVDILLDGPGQKKMINFLGGEPLVEFSLIKRVYQYATNKAKEKKISLSYKLATNGTLLDIDKIEFFKKNKINIQVSIDGDKNCHDANRPLKESANSSFELIFKNINSIDVYQSGITSSLVFAPRDIKTLMQNIKFLHAKKFSVINFLPDLYATWSSDDLGHLVNFFKEFKKYYIGLFDVGGDVFKNNLLDSFVNEVNLDKARQCNKINLNIDGDFYVCDKVLSLKKAERSTYIVGSAEAGLDDEKRADLLLELRNGFLKNSGLGCARCHYAKYCFCPVGHYIYYQHNDGDSHWENYCFISKIYIKTFLSIKKELELNAKFIKTYRF